MVYSQAFREAAIVKFGEVGSYWKAAKILQVSIATLHRWVRQHEQGLEQRSVEEDRAGKDATAEKVPVPV